MTVYLVHGFNSRKHAVWMESLADVIENEGLEVVMVNYGYTSLLNVHNRTQYASKDLAGIVKPGDVAIGHSNGCRLILDAVMRGAPLEHVLFINPALEPHVLIPFWVGRLDVFYAPNDQAVVWGKWLRRVNPLRLFGWSSRWGEMGRVGYQGGHHNAHNWNLGRIGHSGALEFNRRPRTGRILVDLITKGQGPSDQPIFRS